MTVGRKREKKGFSGAVEVFRTALQHLRSLYPDKPLLIAIGGLTAAGKSTLATIFQRAAINLGLPVCVIEGDRFILPQERRGMPEIYPDTVYEMERLGHEIAALKAGASALIPLYHKEGMSTARRGIPRHDLQDRLSGAARIERRGDLRIIEAPDLRRAYCQFFARQESRLFIDVETGDLLEEVVPRNAIVIFDSEVALAYPDLRALYDDSYAIYAPKERRQKNFLDAIRRGKRYPCLTREQALEKMEQFFAEDDRFNVRSLRYARVLINNRYPLCKVL